MGGLSSIWRGAGRSLVRWKATLAVYGVTLLFAGILAAPVLTEAVGELGHAPLPDASAETAYELVTRFDLGARFGVAGALYLVLATFLSGGVYAAMCRRPGDVHFASIFFDSAGYFGRFFRLLLVGWLGLVVLQTANTWLDGQLAILFSGRESSTTFELVQVGRSGAFAFAAFLFLLVLDYARVRVVVEGRKSVGLALLAGAGFVMRAPISAVLVQVTFVAIDVALFLSFLAFQPTSLDPTLTVGIVAAQQGLMLLRTGVRSASRAAQVDLFLRLSPGLMPDARFDAGGGEESTTPAEPAPETEERIPLGKAPAGARIHQPAQVGIDAERHGEGNRR